MPSFIRTKKVDFSSLDKRTAKGDVAEIHGVSMGEFLRVQEILTDDSGNQIPKYINDANIEIVAYSCHKLKIGGIDIEVTRENILDLDALYFNLLLGEVMRFHEFGESEKN
ncbi:MAG TPA: hypothetical protein PKV16_04725 [Caldisericia bacterium]|nr:hypothetical protein [Caldisericia bacterium]HPF48615.1 hypothetical protein [Caldisericia bacterium]HPI83725.1 hypothetical protein [Caldisericia bacterium]HPQ93070.1 hypothetical protein [Caldisericia bacterium]HRV75097.1 hypothetical protein [Caldisericia bacterium]